MKLGFWPAKLLILKSVMDAATAGLLGTAIGAAIGFFGNASITWINRSFDEKRARRELKTKTAFDYWQTAFQKTEAVPFEASFFLAIKIMELTERKHLSEEEFVAELKKLDQVKLRK
jgi:hypothetical protein